MPPVDLRAVILVRAIRKEAEEWGKERGSWRKKEKEEGGKEREKTRGRKGERENTRGGEERRRSNKRSRHTNRKEGGHEKTVRRQVRSMRGTEEHEQEG